MSTEPHIPLVSPDAWTKDVWIRQRSGPNPKATVRRGTEVSIWHRVRDVVGDTGWGSRLRTTCGYGPRDGFTWPSGGARMEVARPLGFGGLPGEVCPRCRTYPAMDTSESEVTIADDLDIDALADAVAQRLIDRVDSQRGEA